MLERQRRRSRATGRRRRRGEPRGRRPGPRGSASTSAPASGGSPRSGRSTWDVYAGQMSLIVGPSGCGKTTLALGDRRHPQRGRGVGRRSSAPKSRRMKDRGPKTRFRARNIGFVFQQYNLLPALTAAENAAIPLVIAGWSKAPAVAKAKEVLGSLGMGKKFREPAQPALGRPAAAGGDRPGPGPRAHRSWSATSRPPRSTTRPA